MNRAQRRAKKRKPVCQTHARGIDKFYARIHLSNATQAGDEDIQTLILPAYVLIDRLMSGTLDLEGFVNLNEVICAAFCLAKELHRKAANDDTRGQIEPSQPQFEAAAEALAEIGVRFGKTSHYVAKMEEIELLRTSIAWYEQLILVSDRAHVVHALIEAQTMVEKELLRLEKLNG